MALSLDAWLGQGDPLDADWSGHVNRLAMRGQLGAAGDLLLDLPALAAPYACEPDTCTPGRRAPRTRSCCADLDVELAPEEVAAIEAHLPAVAAAMAPVDPRWAEGAPTWQEASTLSRPGKRCIFAVPEADGLRCGLHRLEDADGLPRGTVKPLPCRLFPLIVVDLGDQRLLTAVSRANIRNGAPSPRWFPCLRGDVQRPAPLAEGVLDTITEVWGPRVARAVRKAVREFAAD